MRSAVMAAFIDLAKKHAKTNSLANLVHASTEVGVVVPSILTAKLKEAGYEISAVPGKHTVAVTVSNLLGKLVSLKEPHGMAIAAEVARDPKAVLDQKQKVIVAYGVSHDGPDALLQAIYEELKGLK